MADLEKWVQKNEQELADAKRMFWVLKAPVICVTASTSVFAGLGMKTEGIIAGAVAAALVSVEGKNPYARIQKNCDLAIHELRHLEYEIQSRWEIGSLERKEREALLAEIIAHVKKEKTRILNYLKPSASKTH